MSLILLWIFSGLDLLSTYRFLALGHAEGNPLMAGLSPLGMALWKVLMMAGATSIVIYTRQKMPRLRKLTDWGCYGASGLMFCVVLWNLAV